MITTDVALTSYKSGNTTTFNYEVNHTFNEVKIWSENVVRQKSSIDNLVTVGESKRNQDILHQGKINLKLNGVASTAKDWGLNRSVVPIFKNCVKPG